MAGIYRKNHSCKDCAENSNRPVQYNLHGDVREQQKLGFNSHPTYSVTYSSQLLSTLAYVPTISYPRTPIKGIRRVLACLLGAHYR